MIKLRKVLSSLVAVGVSGLLLVGCGKSKIVDTVITDDTPVSGRVEQNTDYESSSLGNLNQSPLMRLKKTAIPATQFLQVRLQSRI